MSDCKGGTLFQLDSQRLQTVAGMVAILHGPSVDDGVCMEIGYAAYLGVPVVALTTDFQTYGLREDGPTTAFPDPLLEALLTDIVRSARLGPCRERPSRDRFTAFLGRNLAPLRPAARLVVERLLSQSCAGRERRPSPTIVRSADTRRAFIEPSPYQRPGSSDAVRELLCSRGWEVETARRWDIPEGLNQTELHERALADWSELADAELLVADVNGPETPPGAALLIGASVAAGRRILAAYQDRSFTFASGREVNFRNLMIQYAITGRFQSVGELAKLLDER